MKSEKSLSCEKNDGIICYAGVDWWYHNRGHSECQIMTRLSRYVPVLWVNSIGMRAPMPGKTELPFRRYVRKIKSTLKGLRRDQSGMWVYSPIFIPRYTRRWVQINGILLNFQIKLLCKILKIHHPSAWVTLPTVAPAVGRKNWDRLVFNRSDDFSAFPEVDCTFIKPLEQQLLNLASNVLYVNRKLFEREASSVSNAIWLGHGVDYDHFSRARTINLKQNIPLSIQKLPRPIVGFYGALDDYTIDLDLMIKVARQIKSGTLLVIGPKAMDIKRLVAEPNVCYLGPVSYQEIPYYASQFDVGIMPWLQNKWIEGCNPIKLKEYLSLGFPVVSISFNELEKYKHLVYVADSHESFLNKLVLALKEHDPLLVAKRQEAVANDSWDIIADKVAKLMNISL